jgi:glycosyltransferase involved in cell wall biosynthesis
MPLLSVIIPCFHAAATLARAVDSLRAQTLGDWEALIVSDDGQDYAPLLAPDPRLRFLSTGRAGAGAPAARNVGLAAAWGALVAPLDADDLYAPERLRRLAPLALAAGAAFDDVRVVDDASGATLQLLFGRTADFTLDAAGFFQTSVPLMPVFRRDLGVAWDPAVELCDDVALNLRLLDRVPAIPVAHEALHDYRVRHGSICHADNSAERAERGYATLLARLAADGYGLGDPALVRLAARAIGRKQALNRAFAAARAAGEVATFQEFLVRRANPSPAGQVPDSGSI